MKIKYSFVDILSLDGVKEGNAEKAMEEGECKEEKKKKEAKGF